MLDKRIGKTMFSGQIEGAEIDPGALPGAAPYGKESKKGVTRSKFRVGPSTVLVFGSGKYQVISKGRLDCREEVEALRRMVREAYPQAAVGDARLVCADLLYGLPYQATDEVRRSARLHSNGRLLHPEFRDALSGALSVPVKEFPRYDPEFQSAVFLDLMDEEVPARVSMKDEGGLELQVALSEKRCGDVLGYSRRFEGQLCRGLGPEL